MFNFKEETSANFLTANTSVWWYYFAFGDQNSFFHFLSLFESSNQIDINEKLKAGEIFQPLFE